MFFCGSGISCPAGLPRFEGLTDKIYEHLGMSCGQYEKNAYDKEQYEMTLELLERRLSPGSVSPWEPIPDEYLSEGRIKVRRTLMKILRPKQHHEEFDYTRTHAALLQLACNRKGTLRLVTTNFDRIFHHAANRAGQKFISCTAPMLPIPKDSSWNGLVHLHGLLPPTIDESELNKLVLTSGDFGLAYFVERWASRFVSELLRSYIVCFVGYSLDDVVLRYMMDALAADRRLGGSGQHVHYAFAACASEEEDNESTEWRTKNVVPIFYERPSKSDDHSLLHETLVAWADIYREGIFGKERIIVNHALAQPSDSTQQEDFVGRVLWALSDNTGLPAKRFANFNPVPPFDWLYKFIEDRYQYDNLRQFGISPHNRVAEDIKFSLLHRPSPYNLAGWTSIIVDGTAESRWDEVMTHLSDWLMRHMNDFKLVIWLVGLGGRLHRNLVRLIEDKLEHFAELRNEGRTDELEEIQNYAPNAVPDRLMSTVWRLMLAGRIRSSARSSLFFTDWLGRLGRYGLTPALQLELHDFLAPKIIVKEPFSWAVVEDIDEAPKHNKQSIQCDMVLATDYVRSYLSDHGNIHWQKALPKLLRDLEQLLLDASALLHELDEADDRSDRSYWALPSISDHKQNRYSQEWVVLVEQLRDSWLAVRAQDMARASRIAYNWYDLGYPIFVRLALFAASHDECVSADDWVDWLLAHDSRWLWINHPKRETLRLLVLQGKYLTGQAQERLEIAILQGPHNNVELEGVGNTDQQTRDDHAVWLRLAKLNSSGLVLDETAQTRLDDLSRDYPEWELAEDQRDEFSIWMSTTGDSDHEEEHETIAIPRKRQELVVWLRQSPRPHPFYGDNWQGICERYPLNVGYALFDLANENQWPVQRWVDAFYAWSKNVRICRITWKHFACKIEKIPNNELQNMIHGIVFWLQKISELANPYDAILLDQCQRILELPLEPESGISWVDQPIDPVSEAINHPIGYVTKTALNLWFRRMPNDKDQLPPDIKRIFKLLCDIGIERFKHGRVLLAWQLIPLFRADRAWTKEYLLPLFDWRKKSSEALLAWEGFLWSPRLYEPLLSTLKPQLLETARHYEELGVHREQFSRFLTYIALNFIGGYSSEDISKAIKLFPDEGRQEVAETLMQATKNSGDERKDYYKKYIQPFWRNIWLQAVDHPLDDFSEPLACLCIVSDDEFPLALADIIGWLRSIEYSDYTVSLLFEYNLCTKYPEDALKLLDSIIDNQYWVPSELRNCLDEIAEAAPGLKQSRKYQKLIEYIERKTRH